MDILLVRHSLTDWNKEKRYLGHTDRGVEKSGLIQLEKLQKELRERSFDDIFTSDLRRCQETLAYLDIPGQVSIDARLREINFGDWEGKTYDELKDQQIYRNWLDNWEDSSIPNGESAHTFKERIDSFFQDLFESSIETTHKGKKRILIITHGGVIRYFISRVKTSTSFWDLSVSHGEGIKLTFVRKEGEWICNSLSAVPFREKEK